MTRAMCKPGLTKAEIARMVNEEIPVPLNFTGKYGTTYYYKGQRWSGPTNVLGRKKILGFKKFVGLQAE